MNLQPLISSFFLLDQKYKNTGISLQISAVILKFQLHPSSKIKTPNLPQIVEELLTKTHTSIMGKV